MELVFVADQTAAAKILAGKITESLKKDSTLWLVSGGSNIPLSVMVMNAIRESVPKNALKKLTVALTDERYGPIGHPDSNWKQLIDRGFHFDGIDTIPVLIGATLEETVDQYSKKLEQAFEIAVNAIGQLGIGADGHIAGVLPHTAGVSDTALVCAYESEPFTRITLTLAAFSRLTSALAFVFGPSKRNIVSKLKNENIPLPDMPSQILKAMSDSYLYTDQLTEEVS